MAASGNGRAPSAIVIGAGAIGTAAALQIARAGVATRLIDPDAPGAGCSSGNAGSISEQSIVPIALPGMLAQVPRWLLDPEGPLHVRWRYLPRAFPWLLRWVLASRPAVVERSAVALKSLLDGAVDDYADLLGQRHFDALVRRRGQLLVWESAEPSRSARVGHALRARHGVAMRWLTPGEIAELEPGLKPIFARGLLLERHGQLLDPRHTVKVMAEELRRLEGKVERTRAVDIAPGEGGGATVTLAGGTQRRAEHVVVAAGAWSGELARRLGLAVPLETERGYHAMLEGQGDLCSRPVMHGDRGFIASPMCGGLRVAGTVEIAGLAAAPRYERARVLLAQARRMFRGLEARDVAFWIGRRPSLPDSVPVIGPSPRTPSVLFAFGHGRLGMTAAPATARIIRDLVLGRRPNVDIAPFRIDRS